MVLSSDKKVRIFQGLKFLTFLSLYSTTYKQLSSSVSKFYSKLKVLRYRRSGGRTELSEHQNTGNFAENPNSMVPRAGLRFFEVKQWWIFPRAKRAVYVQLVETMSSGNCFGTVVTKR